MPRDETTMMRWQRRVNVKRTQINKSANLRFTDTAACQRDGNRETGFIKNVKNMNIKEETI